MKRYDVFKSPAGNFWFVLWDASLSNYRYLSHYFGSLEELLPVLRKEARSRGIDLQIIIDGVVAPAKYDFIGRWKNQGNEYVELDPESLAITD